VTAALQCPLPGGSALVTGGRSGIGRSIVEVLVGAGVPVISMDVSPVDVVASTRGVREVVGDVTDEHSVRSGIADAGAEENVAYLVNCAGIHLQTSLVDTSPDEWSRMLSINLVGPAIVAQACLPLLAKSGCGSIVNITSLEATRIVALVHPEPVGHYAASKAALEMLTRTMARDYARFGVRVNAVAPGFIFTPMAAHNHGGATELPAAVQPRVPMGRYADPAEVGRVVAFLLSDAASYITGASVLVDGGYCTT